ncbi:hypothetical protein HGRIS_011889 [Hohenbuehelia grisea]|uniref:tRNA (uracil-O(2)-)-methyltransferase n=1 Tax=Hohenbuehelia grisea TaxID=104357 RepID=A0ABR3JWF9_9AGAR
MTSGRPRFEPSPVPSNASPLALRSDETTWKPLVSCPADFPPEIFRVAILQMLLHPEHNSTLILRAEILSDTIVDIPALSPCLEGMHASQNIHRKLLPRRPGRDAGIEQHCTFYQLDEEASDPSVLVISPIVSAPAQLPYYHPRVVHLAFRYVHDTAVPLLRIEVLPLPNTPTDLDSRLYRTGLALLDTVHRYGWGALTNYKKRVEHDCLVERESYQDIYLIMRERHKHLVNTWCESTDPLKHVFEDIGIATYLMLLWKETFAAENGDLPPSAVDKSDPPWKNWPRSPGGFLDLGCGNGLLVHILTAEGYDGQGIDLRARTSWEQYPPSTQERLYVHAFDPESLCSSSSEHPFFKPGAFIIGNHADELTPWVPVISKIRRASGYLSIPCCAFLFDARFTRSATTPFPESLEHGVDEFVQSLHLGGEGATSSYAMYRIWLASLSLHCGWQIECDTLRIPSTRSWAIVGRKRSAEVDSETASENVERILRQIMERGVFKPRAPEGSASH